MGERRAFEKARPLLRSHVEDAVEVVVAVVVVGRKALNKRTAASPRQGTAPPSAAPTAALPLLQGTGRP